MIQFIFGVSSQMNRTNCTKDLFFWVCNFHEFIFLGLIFPGIYFFGYPKNAWAKPPCHLHVRIHSLGGILKTECFINLSYEHVDF